MTLTPESVKAKRGDLRAVPFRRSDPDQNREHQEYYEWRLEWITSVSREGIAKAGRPIESLVWLENREIVEGQLIVPQSRVDTGGLEAAARERESADFDSLDELRDFVRPFLVDAT